MAELTVWIVLVGGRVSSARADEPGAVAHMARLVEVNGDQLAVRVEGILVRGGSAVADGGRE